MTFRRGLAAPFVALAIAAVASAAVPARTPGASLPTASAEPPVRLPPELASKRVVFVRRDGVYVARADGSRLRRIVDLPGVFEYQPDWSPDGRWIALRVDEGCPGGRRCGTWLVSSDGRRRLHLSRMAGVPGGAADWAPDSKRVAYVGKRSKDRYSGIYVVSIEGSMTARRLTPNTSEAQYPAWSPDGKRIAYVHVVPPATFDIYVVDQDGLHPRRVTSDLGWENYPAWSPDGSKLVYSTSRPNGDDLGMRVLTLRTGKSVSVSAGGEPQWEPRDWIIFDCPHSRAGASCVVRPDGSSLSRLPLPPASVFPNWAPTGMP